MEKDKALKTALELIAYTEKNRLFANASDEELQAALLGGMLVIVHGGDKTAICVTLEVAREIIRRFQPKPESVEVPVDLV